MENVLKATMCQFPNCVEKPIHFNIISTPYMKINTSCLLDELAQQAMSVTLTYVQFHSFTVAKLIWKLQF